MRSAPRALPVSIILLRRLAKYHCGIRFVHHQGHPKHRAFFALRSSAPASRANKVNSSSS